MQKVYDTSLLFTTEILILLSFQNCPIEQNILLLAKFYIYEII